jgi:hypothetical protein
MQACEAGNMNFALAELTVPPNGSTQELRDAWRLASLASLQATELQTVSEPRLIKGGKPSQALMTRVTTHAHQTQFIWFITKQTIYQAAVYAQANDKGFAEAAETYTSGIKWP